MSKKNKICVYTCITGDYDNPKEILKLEKGIDYYCFTNNKKIKSAVRSKNISGDNLTFTISNQGIFVTGKSKRNIKKELIDVK